MEGRTLASLSLRLSDKRRPTRPFEAGPGRAEEGGGPGAGRLDERESDFVRRWLVGFAISSSRDEKGRPRDLSRACLPGRLGRGRPAGGAFPAQGLLQQL